MKKILTAIASMAILASCEPVGSGAEIETAPVKVEFLSKTEKLISYAPPQLAADCLKIARETIMSVYKKHGYMAFGSLYMSMNSESCPAATHGGFDSIDEANKGAKAECQSKSKMTCYKVFEVVPK